MRTLPLAALLLMVLPFSCESYEPTPYAGFHLGMPLAGTVHEVLDCEACHRGGAEQQGVPFDIQGTAWATNISGVCYECHPYTANLVTPVVCATPNDNEYCRFTQGYHAGVNVDNLAISNIQNCTQCHSVTLADWASFGGGPDGGGNPHPNPPLVDIFPLINGHATAGCTDCHGAAGTEANERGKGEFCANCHGRVRDQAPNGAGHYAPARAGASEKERDCKACHTQLTPGNTLVWPSAWDEQAVDHAFLTPHRTVNAWYETPPVVQPETGWKYQCWSCHNSYPASNPSDGAGTQQGPAPVQIYLQATGLQGATSCRNGCHATLEHGTTYDTQSCTGAGCHETAGPNDDATPGP